MESSNIPEEKFEFLWDKQLSQQDYYGPQNGTLLHSKCTPTYTKVVVLFLWSSSTVTSTE